MGSWGETNKEPRRHLIVTEDRAGGAQSKVQVQGKSVEIGPWRDALNPLLLCCGSPFSGWLSHGWGDSPHWAGTAVLAVPWPRHPQPSPGPGMQSSLLTPAGHVSSPFCLHPGSHLAPFPGPWSPPDRLLLQSFLGRSELVARVPPNPAQSKMDSLAAHSGCLAWP